MTDSCGECRFYDTDAHCYTGAMESGTRWPNVQADDWCGEFERP